MNTWPHRWHVRFHVPRFLKACPDPFRGEVLEVGAGSGWTSQQILNTFPQVELTATDVDEGATRRFERLTGQYGKRLHVQEADIFALPFGRESFDIVLAINVLRHLDSDRVSEAILQMLRVMRPGGLIGVSEYAAWLPSHRLSRTAVENVLEDEGCDILYATGGRGYDLWARKPYPVESSNKE